MQDGTDIRLQSYAKEGGSGGCGTLPSAGPFTLNSSKAFEREGNGLAAAVAIDGKLLAVVSVSDGALYLALVDALTGRLAGGAPLLLASAQMPGVLTSRAVRLAPAEASAEGGALDFDFEVTCELSLAGAGVLVAWSTWQDGAGPGTKWGFPLRSR